MVRAQLVKQSQRSAVRIPSTTLTMNVFTRILIEKVKTEEKEAGIGPFKKSPAPSGI